jgi:hypothetical protein
MNCPFSFPLSLIEKRERKKRNVITVTVYTIHIILQVRFQGKQAKQIESNPTGSIPLLALSALPAVSVYEVDGE